MAPTPAPATPAAKRELPPWLVGFWRGTGHALLVSVIGAGIIEITNGRFSLHDLLAPALVLALRTLEGVKDGAAV